ncbi:MAG: pyroglutamyl-peptidase I [Aquabacterium sp.]
MTLALAEPTILLSGFEPFDGEAVNPSWEVARALHGTTVGDARVEALCLPCAFAHALPVLRQALRRQRPAVTLALGLAGSRSAVSVERVAINLMDARIADNAGRQPLDEPVQPGGRAAWFSSLPVKAIVQDIGRAGIAAELSFSAGSFVCNQVFYGLMAAAARRAGMRAGFIHLPPLPSQAARHPGSKPMPLDEQVEAVRIALAVARSAATDARIRGGRED